uniref:C-CAP/cofactor C-like domain-containing protein n=1 Tax=Panagrolaimus sp. JU765 TaxID=591449 RepID=A0AC34R3A0_9BILA
MVCFSGILIAPYIVSELACAGAATIALRVRLISTAFVVTGLTTLLQTVLGLRLAILQGPSFAFLPPLFAFANLPEMKCTANWTDFVPEEVYYEKIRTIQGSLALSALLLIFIGATGLIGFISRHIGPITICPVVILLCIGNVHVVVEKAEQHWISIFQFTLLMLFALYLSEFSVPIPYYSNGKINYAKYRLFGQFPYLISILIAYGVAFTLSKTNLVPPESAARIDKEQALNTLHESPWIQVPYPGQFGLPRLSVGLFLGMLASCVACAVESLGAYGILAKVSDEKAPPSSTLNRAIVIEGIGCCLAGLMGSGVGITTYSENVAAVSITRVASRYTMQIAGCMLIFLGIFTKVAAILATIPDPMVGGILGMGICMICGVAFSNLEFVNIKLSRNITIMGVAVIVGNAIPDYFSNHPINTGITEIDQMFNILLTIKMFVGGVIAFILDNSCGGATRAERGFPQESEEFVESTGADSKLDGYAFPHSVNEFLRKYSAESGISGPSTGKFFLDETFASEENFGAKNYQNFDEELFTFEEFLIYTDRTERSGKVDAFDSIPLDSPHQEPSNSSENRQQTQFNNEADTDPQSSCLPFKFKSTTFSTKSTGQRPSSAGNSLPVADFSRVQVPEASPLPQNLGPIPLRSASTESVDMGIIQMFCCIRPQNRSHRYHVQETTSAPEEATRVAQYSWDVNRVDPKDYTLSSKTNEVVIKKTGEINGQLYAIENCKDCVVIVLDHSGAITVDDCDDCLFVFGPCSGSVFIRNCTNCHCFSISKQFRVRDSILSSHLFCSTSPVIEESKVEFFPLYINYDNLDDHMISSKLSPYYNSWDDVYDYTPDKQQSNFKINDDPQETEVEDKLGLIASAYQLDFAREHSFFIQPNMVKNTKSGDEIALVLHKQDATNGKNDKEFFEESKKLVSAVLKDSSVNFTNMKDINVQKGDLQVAHIKTNQKLIGHIAIFEFVGKNCRRHCGNVVAELNKQSTTKSHPFELVTSDNKEAIFRFADMKHTV